MCRYSGKRWKKMDYAACDSLLPAMIQSYKQFIAQPDTEFVFSVIAKTNEQSHSNSINGCSNGWSSPSQQLPGCWCLIMLMVTFWGEVFENYSDYAVTLKHDLRMQDAIRQIATAGAATDPHAFFQKMYV